MKVNIYYGGRGLIDDPAIYVIDKMTEVLEEIRVSVTRYNLYEQKNGLSVLPNTLKEADGVILAANVEWMGIGVYLQQFLDACWLYADKEKLSHIYMLPVVTASTCGEKQALQTLVQAWELLGGIPCDGVCAYVENRTELENNPDYVRYIEKRAEDLYRAINQKVTMLPSSTNAVKQSILHNNTIALSPQESEQLSAYVSDETYVKKQKEDIEELTSLFKGMLDGSESTDKHEFIRNLRENYRPQGPDFTASYVIHLSDLEKTLVIEVANNNLKCYYGEKSDADVVATTTREVMEKLVHGRSTFQGSFMSGTITAKGNFKMLRTFDQVFQFDKL